MGTGHPGFLLPTPTLLRPPWANPGGGWVGVQGWGLEGEPAEPAEAPPPSSTGTFPTTQISRAAAVCLFLPTFLPSFHLFCSLA